MATTKTKIRTRRLTIDEKPNFSWLDHTDVQKVISALSPPGVDAPRFVGGCVRDSLLRHQVHDLDMATPLEPKPVLAALQFSGIKSVPTGMDHGTITAVCGKQVIEITSLRKDVSTDGRRATVAFTQNWQEDAARRDFTMNALYLSADGTIYDYCGGLDDLDTGLVQFIGDPHDRIIEDYLRILRFFRFSARFGQGFDERAIAAIRDSRQGISTLSRERIGDELKKILVLPNAVMAVDGMAETGVLNELWNGDLDLSSLRKLKSSTVDIIRQNTDFISVAGDHIHDSVLALAVLFVGDGSELATAMRLSNRRG